MDQIIATSIVISIAVESRAKSVIASRDSIRIFHFAKKVDRLMDLLRVMREKFNHGNRWRSREWKALNKLITNIGAINEDVWWYAEHLYTEPPAEELSHWDEIYGDEDLNWRNQPARIYDNAKIFGVAKI